MSVCHQHFLFFVTGFQESRSWRSSRFPVRFKKLSCRGWAHSRNPFASLRVTRRRPGPIAWWIFDRPGSGEYKWQPIKRVLQAQAFRRISGLRALCASLVGIVFFDSVLWTMCRPSRRWGGWVFSLGLTLLIIASDFTSTHWFQLHSAPIHFFASATPAIASLP